MNDPHVVALRYRVHHHDRVDYSRAEPLAFDTPEFLVEVKDQKARFQLKQHYATEEDARRVVEPFIQNWEFVSSLSRDPDCFRLEFEGAEIIDRRPNSGVVHGKGMHATFKISIPPAKGTAYARIYPPPPSGINSAHGDVRVLFHRYERYKAGKEPLTSFAYYCYTEIVQGERGQVTAASRYNVSRKLLRCIAKLSSRKGGTEARKAAGTGLPLTQDERRFLERGVVRLIRRVAEYHANPQCLPEITINEMAQLVNRMRYLVTAAARQARSLAPGGEADEVEPAQVVVQIAGGDAAAGTQEVLQPTVAAVHGLHMQIAPNPFPHRAVECFVAHPERGGARWVARATVGDQQGVLRDHRVEGSRERRRIDPGQHRADRRPAPVRRHENRHLLAREAALLRLAAPPPCLASQPAHTLPALQDVGLVPLPRSP